MHPPFRIAAIGELLWDLLPDGPQLGGGPANFASLSANFAGEGSAQTADKVFLISRVGNDLPGRQALDQLRAHRVVSDFISIDPAHATGSVTVTWDADASPRYRIDEDAAWDFIPRSPSLATLAPTLDAICFGTLAQRSSVTRETLRHIIEATRPDCIRVLDVNLRPPYWNRETLAWGCERATVLKMNEEEVSHVAHGVAPSLQETGSLAVAQVLLRRFPMKLVAITRGARGCLLVTRESACDHPGAVVDVIDSVGAGDAFTAALTSAMLRQLPLAVIAETANRWGGWMATQRGGMPLPDENVRRECKLAIDTTLRCGNPME